MLRAACGSAKEGSGRDTGAKSFGAFQLDKLVHGFWLEQPLFLPGPDSQIQGVGGRQAGSSGRRVRLQPPGWLRTIVTGLVLA